MFHKNSSVAKPAAIPRILRRLRSRTIRTNRPDESNSSHRTAQRSFSSESDTDDPLCKTNDIGGRGRTNKNRFSNLVVILEIRRTLRSVHDDLVCHLFDWSDQLRWFVAFLRVESLIGQNPIAQKVAKITKTNELFIITKLVLLLA